MTPSVFTLTLHSCSKVFSAATEDELAEVGIAHAGEHGHHIPPSRDHVLPRIRRRT